MVVLLMGVCRYLIVTSWVASVLFSLLVGPPAGTPVAGMLVGLVAVGHHDFHACKDACFMPFPGPKVTCHAQR
jgi:hypothetical protein